MAKYQKKEEKAAPEKEVDLFSTVDEKQTTNTACINPDIKEPVFSVEEPVVRSEQPAHAVVETEKKINYQTPTMEPAPFPFPSGGPSGFNAVEFNLAAGSDHTLKVKPPEGLSNSYRCISCGCDTNAVCPTGRCPACEAKIDDTPPPAKVNFDRDIRHAFKEDIVPQPKNVASPSTVNMVRTNPVFDACVRVDLRAEETAHEQARRAVAAKKAAKLPADTIHVIESDEKGTVIQETGNPAPDLAVTMRPGHDA